MIEVHRQRNIEAAIKRDVDRYAPHLTQASAQRVSADALKAASGYGADVLKGISGEGTFQYLSLDAEGTTREHLKLVDLIERIRQQEVVVRGEQRYYPSRPMLTAMSVRALVGDQMRIRASIAINESREDASIARFYGLNSAGYWVNDATESINRAEGVLKNGLRTEALAAYADPAQAPEDKIAEKEKMYASYLDRLQADITGVGVMELSLIKTLRIRYAPESKVDSVPEIRLYSEYLALEAYKLIYDKTAPNSK